MFPSVLRDPILRKVQFSTISRIDDLGMTTASYLLSWLTYTVNAVYDEFKRDFFPGEEVVVLMDDSQDHVTGVVREKAKFPMIRGPQGEVQREAFSRYFVRAKDDAGKERLVDDKHVRRDRRVFTKQNLRAFLKHTLQREAWIGAPWLVKEPLAIQYKLPMEIPAHLLQDARLLANKVSVDTNFQRSSHVLAHANIVKQHLLQMKPPRKRTKNFSQDDDMRARHEEMQAMQAQMQQVSGCTVAGTQFTADVLKHPGASHLHPGRVAIPALPPQPKILPPPPPKYPMEDLDLPPKRNKVTRPTLQFFTEEMERNVAEGQKTPAEDLEMASMGMLLEVWNTLNVQCEVYVLDSFTFDDFVDAMNYHSIDPSCELLNEMFCAVLKLLVDDKGRLTLSKGALPEMLEESEEEESEEPQDESEVSTPLPDAPARSTRSRLSQMELSNSPPAAPEKMHRAAELFVERDWITRLAARDFEYGGWQVVLVGLLHQLSQSSVYKARCDAVLAWLAPLDQEPTQETTERQFTSMSINLRISALQMITILSIATPSIKEFLETCSEDMTDVRKKKIDHQRLRKAAIEELQYKDRDRKILLPANMLEDSPEVEIVDAPSVNGDGDGDEIVVSHIISSDDEDEAPSNGRSLRRGNDRKRKREAEAARAAEEKKKLELAKQQPKQSKEFKKLLVDIEALRADIRDHETKIADCDADLREANVQRTKVLGKDRFCNRYYWFERNGQPFGGLPSSSTAHYGYANGRIWVQGPDAMERDGFIDRTPDEQRNYKHHFGLTVHERRAEEEGTTNLGSANEWGFYDSPDKLDHLIAWLDERGEREKKLRRELFEWRDTIVLYMSKHAEFKADEVARKLEADDESTIRISTRNKANESAVAGRQRCLKWRNGMAVEKEGHLHSVGEKKVRKVQVRAAKGVAVTVPVNRFGKRVTRQGV